MNPMPRTPGIGHMPGNTASSARDYLDHLGALVSSLDCPAIDLYADLLFDAWRDDRQVLVFGNGGSAATASHFVTDLVKTAAVEGQRRLRALSLFDNVPLTTAIGNDIGYEDTLLYPLEAYAREGDLVVAISGSGTSPNVVKACRWAKEQGLTIVALTGFGGGVLKDIADHHVNVGSENYGVIEDLHLSIGHMVIQRLQALVERATSDASASTPRQTD